MEQRQNVLVVTFSPYEWEGYRNILAPIFENEPVDLHFASISHPDFPDIPMDLLIVAYEELGRYAQSKYKADTPTISLSYTLKREQVAQFSEICKYNRISVVSDTLGYSSERIAMLIALGIPSQCLKPWAPGSNETELESHIIRFEDTPIKNTTGKQIYDIGNVGRGYITIDTLYQILISLDQLHLAKSPAFLQYEQEVHPIHAIYEKTDLTEFYSYLHNADNRRGCLLFSSQDEVYYCNTGARYLLGKHTRELMGKSIYELFPFLSKYKEKLDTYREQVVSVNGKQLIVEVWRTSTHDVSSGYIVLSDYIAEAKKELRIRKQMIGKKNVAKYNFSMIKGHSPAMENCKRIAWRIAGADSGVLIIGPSGAGKELFAQSIHNASSRAFQPFVSVNCGAIVDSLLESELFGYEAGTFTGANKEGKMGLFELAHNGTLFMDEVGDMPMNLQVKLLRVLQEKEIVRVGGREVIPINVRIIAATNKNLRELVREGKFRLDLYYRLNILPLNIPGLNERRDDIPELFEEMQKKYHANFRLNDEAMKILINHNYEGNVRELQNIAEYLSSLGQAEIRKEDLPEYMFENMPVPVCTSVLNKEEQHILDAVKAINADGIGAGRRSIYAWLNERGTYFSEAKIGKLVSQLAQKGYVQVNRGRGGITLIKE